MSEDLVQYLPGSLREMALEVGIRSVLALTEWRGGTVIKIPKHPKNTLLAQRIGMRAASWLCEAYGGEQFRVDRCARLAREIRNAQIREAHEAGASAPRLALAHGLTERQVRSILAATRQNDERQPQLL